MSTWLPLSAAQTNSELTKPRVRAFHDTVVRFFHAMQRQQKCLEVQLPQREFPTVYEGNAGRFFMCRVADNMNPRIWTQDRELVLRVVRPGLMGVSPEVHGGCWLSSALVDSFVFGLCDEIVPETKYLCPRALEGKCTGRKTLCTPKDKKVVSEAHCEP